MRLAAALLDHSGLRVTLIADDQSGLSARLQGGTELRLGDGSVLDRKLVVAASLLAKRPRGTDGEPLPLKYLDVSVPDHPVLRGEQPDSGTAADGEEVDLGSPAGLRRPGRHGARRRRAVPSSPTLDWRLRESCLILCLSMIIGP